MGKFFKSNTFIAIAFFAVFLAVTVTAACAFGYGSYIKNAINTALSPLQALADTIGESLDGYSAYITKFDSIKNENAELKKQIAQLRDQIYDAEALKTENEFLKNYLELKEKNLDFKLQDAYVIGRESGNHSSVFSLNKGTDVGIDINEPIVDPGGALIGYIAESGTNWSKAYTILNSSAAIGVYNERSGAVGIVFGEYELSRKGLMKLEYLSADADIQEGDRIVTSGKGSVYPADLAVGIVEQVITDNNLRTKYALIRPCADMNAPERVMVVTEFDKTENNTQVKE